MKNNNSKLVKRLSQYGSFALAVAGVSEANGQVIYTDISPDFFGGLDSFYAIDLNNDGIDDLTFENVSSGDRKALYGIIYSPGGILGNMTVAPFPIALGSGEIISSGASDGFYNDTSQNYNIMYSYNTAAPHGNWGNVTDKYLGVRFDVSGQSHYGWVRLDVNMDAEFTVKDYAYEATPGMGITAGDLSVKSQDFENFSFYPNPAEDILHLKISGSLSIQKIRITDIQGKTVKEYPGNSRQLDVNNLAAGNYFLQVFTKQGKMTKKIMVK